VTNNHYLGKAVVNAFEMLAILRAQPLPMPPQLLERYPELKPFAEEERKTPEQSSFDLS
jgi:hypothetical protein